jgi:preprotein translocase subunit SecG
MYTVAIVFECLIGILLILAVLMQSSKGAGLAGGLGASNVGAVFGVRRTSDFLTKTTQSLAAAFIVLAMIINLWLLPRNTADRTSVIQQNVPPSTSLPPPQTPTPTQKQ